MDKVIEVSQGMIWIIGVITETIWEVIKGMGDKIIVEKDSGEILKIKAMREVGVGHMVGNSEVITEGTIEVSVTVDQGHVLEWVPIETEIRCFECWEHNHSMRYFPTTQADREVEQIQQKCSIWMKSRHYYRCH